jgi:hypothetical protein
MAPVLKIHNLRVFHSVTVTVFVVETLILPLSIDDRTFNVRRNGRDFIRTGGG